jgi:hypothetical protein
LKTSQQNYSHVKIKRELKDIWKLCSSSNYKHILPTKVHTLM